MKHRAFYHWVSCWRLAQAARQRQRLWSEMCVNKAIGTWKLRVRRQRLQTMCQQYQPVKEKHVLRGKYMLDDQRE